MDLANSIALLPIFSRNLGSCIKTLIGQQTSNPVSTKSAIIFKKITIKQHKKNHPLQELYSTHLQQLAITKQQSKHFSTNRAKVTADNSIDTITKNAHNSYTRRDSLETLPSKLRKNTPMQKGDQRETKKKYSNRHYNNLTNISTNPSNAHQQIISRIVAGDMAPERASSTNSDLSLKK